MKARLSGTYLRWGRNPSVAYVRDAYWRLSKHDQWKLHETIWHTGFKGGRSQVVGLSEPLQINGEHKALRCKGISPEYDDNNELLVHSDAGYDPKPMVVDKDGIAYVGKPVRNPEGTAIFTKARYEFNETYALGQPFTDYPLMYGQYKDLSFRGEPVGYLVFAMQQVKDVRFSEHYFYPGVQREVYQNPDIDFALIEKKYNFPRIIKGLGIRLAFLHQKGRVHRYLHFNNVGIVGEWGVRIRDLESTLLLAEMTPTQRVGYLMLDLARVINECYERRFVFKTQSMLDAEQYRFHLVGMLPHFLEGYTGMRFESIDGFHEFRDLLRRFNRDERINLYKWSKTNQYLDIRLLGEYLTDTYVHELRLRAIS